MSVNRKYYIAIIIVLIFTITVKIKTVLPYSEMNKNIAQMYINFAEKLSKAEQYELSNFYYKAAIKISNKTVWLDYNIGKNIVLKAWNELKSKKRDKNLREAIDRFNIELKKHPNNPNILAQIGHAYYLLEEYDTAIKYYELTLKQTPDWGYGYERISYCYRFKRDYKKSLEYLEKYLGTKPQNIYDTYFGMGWLSTSAGNNAKAVEYYKKATEINPNKIESWINLSYVSEIFLNDYENAVKYADRALDINKFDVYAISNKAYALICMKKYDEALPYVKHNLMYGQGRSYFQMGIIQLAKGNKPEAKKYLLKALDMEKKSDYGDEDIIIEKINTFLKQCD